VTEQAGAHVAKIIPAISELDSLPKAPSIGEWYILNALRALDDDWRIYVQPTIGESHPDFVLAHRLYGVCALEVRDWVLGTHRRNEHGVLEQRLDDSWQPLDAQPLVDARRHRAAIYERFFAIDDIAHLVPPPADFLRAMVVMPRYRTGDARALLCPANSPQAHDETVAVWGGGTVKLALMPVVTGQAKPTDRDVPQQGFERLRRALTVHDELSLSELMLAGSMDSSELFASLSA
jgi:hypothetical protein